MNNAKESVLDKKYTIRTNAENLLDEKNALLDKKEIELTLLKKDNEKLVILLDSQEKSIKKLENQVFKLISEYETASLKRELLDHKKYNIIIRIFTVIFQVQELHC